MTPLTNGLTNGVHSASQADEAIDSLYSFWPGMPPPPPPCPEALFSLTLKGKLDGIETLLTVRGMTPEEFRTNLQSIAGVLDPLPTKAAPAPAPTQKPGQDYCRLHEVTMRWNEGKAGKKGWYSHRLEDGSWCKGR